MGAEALKLRRPGWWAANLPTAPSVACSAYRCDVGATIGLVATAQVGVVAGIGGWFPLAAPALWAMGEPVTAVQLGVVGLIAVASVAVLWRSWQRLQLDR